MVDLNYTFGAKAFTVLIIGAVVGGVLLGWLLFLGGSHYINNGSHDPVRRAGGFTDLQQRQLDPSRK
jgi:hypothetical protein